MVRCVVGIPARTALISRYGEFYSLGCSGYCLYSPRWMLVFNCTPIKLEGVLVCSAGLETRPPSIPVSERGEARNVGYSYSGRWRANSAVGREPTRRAAMPGERRTRRDHHGRALVLRGPEPEAGARAGAGRSGGGLGGHGRRPGVLPRGFAGRSRSNPTRSGSEPCRLEAVPLRGSMRPHVMLYGRRLRALLRERAWDVVHAWEEPYIPAGGQIAWWTPKGVGVCLLYVPEHRQAVSAAVLERIERYCVGRCAGWLAAGESVAEAQRSRGLRL